MAKNKGKGGKRFRKGKNGDDGGSKRELLFKEVNQKYAYVDKALGKGRFRVRILDPDKLTQRVLLATVRGKMRRRVFVHKENFVLVSLRSLREFEDEKADIIHLYTQAEVYQLIGYDELPKNALSYQLGGDAPAEDEDLFDSGNDSDPDDSTGMVTGEDGDVDIDKI
ncbi:Translation initiation factor 1A [Hypoxylon texense]